MAKQRTRSRNLLLLCFLSLFCLSSAMRDMQSNAERFGALCVPLGLYVAGTWCAFRDKSRGARVGALALGLLIFGGFGFGVVKGLRRAAGTAEVNRELGDVRSQLARDLAQDGDGFAAAQNHAARMEQTASKLAQSDSPEAAALGRILQRAAELRAPVESRLEAAIEAVASEGFLDVSALLAGGEFEPQRKTAEEYEHAAHAAFDFYGRLPKLMEPELRNCGLSKEALDGLRAGMERTRTLTIRACQGHGLTASEYAKLIEFLAKNGDEIEVSEDGTMRFATDELSTAYDDCWERIRAAEEKLDAAVNALRDAMTH